jgi:hypothetical protein
VAVQGAGLVGWQVASLVARQAVGWGVNLGGLAVESLVVRTVEPTVAHSEVISEVWKEG